MKIFVTGDNHLGRNLKKRKILRDCALTNFRAILQELSCYLEDCCLRYEKRLWGNSEEKAYYGNEVFHNGLILGTSFS